MGLVQGAARDAPGEAGYGLAWPLAFAAGALAAMILLARRCPARPSSCCGRPLSLPFSRLSDPDSSSPTAKVNGSAKGRTRTRDGALEAVGRRVGQGRPKAGEAEPRPASLALSPRRLPTPPEPVDRVRMVAEELTALEASAGCLPAPSLVERCSQLAAELQAVDVAADKRLAQWRALQLRRCDNLLAYLSPSPLPSPRLPSCGDSPAV